MTAEEMAQELNKAEARRAEFTLKSRLRDEMAMSALQACEGWMQDRIETYPEMAKRCYLMADAMLKAREEK